MKFLEGENLVDGIQQLGERAARRQGLTLDDLKRDMLIKFEREGYPEPYAGPSPFVIEAYRYVDRVRCYPVWKSNFGRPTPSTRCFPRNCVCSMAWRLHAIDATASAHWLISTQVLARERGRVFTKKSVRSRRGVRGTVADGLQPRARHVDALPGARARAVKRWALQRRPVRGAASFVSRSHEHAVAAARRWRGGEPESMSHEHAADAMSWRGGCDALSRAQARRELSTLTRWEDRLY